MPRNMKKLTAALTNPQPAVGGPAYAISKDGKSVIVATETLSGDFVAFEYPSSQLHLTIMELRSASAKAVAVETGGDPKSKGHEVIDSKQGSVVTGPDGKSIILILEDENLKYLVPLEIGFAEFLKDHLEKTLQAVRSETSGMKGSA